MVVNKRKIRSFVIREGRMTPRQNQALDTHWSELGLDYQQQSYDWQAIFGNANPVIIEM